MKSWMSPSDEFFAEGGAAFPTGGNLYTSGMTLRDYFAAAALTGLVVATGDDTWTHEGAASAAYRHADAMITERAK